MSENIKALLFVYADDRELDAARLARQLSRHTAAGRVAFLKTGVGKVRASMEVTSYLSSSLRQGKPRPLVVSIGTCASLTEGLLGKVVRPSIVVDRDSTPQLLTAAGLTPQPAIQLLGSDKLTLGTGDGFLADPRESEKLLQAGVHLADMETHAVAWAANKCLAGRILAIRYVTDEASNSAVRDWVDRVADGRTKLTDTVLQLAG